jgi:hypothetical protein
MEIWELPSNEIPCRSYTSIPVLEFLKGYPYDDFAKAYIFGLSPSTVRVSTGDITCDAYTDRVTVFVDDTNIIYNIVQEICVASPFPMTGAELQSQRPSDPYMQKIMRRIHDKI